MGLCPISIKKPSLLKQDTLTKLCILFKIMFIKSHTQLELPEFEKFEWQFFGLNTFLVLEFYFGRRPEDWGPVIWNLEFSANHLPLKPNFLGFIFLEFCLMLKFSCYYNVRWWCFKKLKELGGTFFFESAVRRLNPDYSIDDQRICTIL